jgi:hypothetical protein
MQSERRRTERSGGEPVQASGVLARLSQGRVMAALGSVFNFLALNAAFVILSLPVVTVPLALVAVTTALDRWRTDGEDRVVREFFVALRSRPFLQTTVVAGAPLVVACTGGEEAHYFVRGGEPVDWVCLGFGFTAAFLAITSLGYVLLLAARHPMAPASEIWSTGARLAVRNVFATGPLFAVEIVGAALLALLDPPLLLIGLPLALLSLMRLTARFGLRMARVDRGAAPAGAEQAG